MKKIIIIAMLAGAAAVTSSCGTKRVVIPTDDDLSIETTVVDDHNSVNSLDYHGTYKGTLPCADCEGIETTLTLRPDNTYEISTFYLSNKNDSTYVSKGKYSWTANGNTIILDNVDNGPDRYQVGENTIYVLDIDGNRIDGPLAEHYILKKQ